MKQRVSVATAFFYGTPAGSWVEVAATGAVADAASDSSAAAVAETVSGPLDVDEGGGDQVLGVSEAEQVVMVPLLQTCFLLGYTIAVVAE